jgi:hypothetical protein
MAEFESVSSTPELNPDLTIADRARLPERTHRPLAIGSATLVLAMASLGVGDLDSASAQNPAAAEAVPALAVAKPKAQACLPDKQVSLSLIGPKKVTPQKSIAYRLKAKDCDPKDESRLKTITLEELGPGKQKHKWLIKDFVTRKATEEKFHLTFPIEPTGNGKSPVDSQTITLEAIRKGKTIGVAREVLKYIMPSTGSMVQRARPLPVSTSLARGLSAYVPIIVTN